MEQVMKAL